MSRNLAIRPTLLPALRRFWRDPFRLQLGTDPGRAIVLELTDPAAARLLDLIDGTRTQAGLIRAAVAADIQADEARRIITELTAAGLVIDAHTIRPAEVAEATRRRLDAETAALAYGTRRRGSTPATVLRRRLAAQVLITGACQLCVPIACTLASSGVGHLDTDLGGVTRPTDAAPGGLVPGDAHRPRGIAAADAVRRAAPDVDLGPLRAGQATFAVLVGFDAPATLTALSYGARRLAHLAVAIRDGTVVVGPLVVPGRTPCLNCLDLHRRDRDPGWPAIAAQLQTPTDIAEPVAATTALSAAAYAAAEVLTHIDGGVPRTLGATVEIRAAGEWVRRRWSQHPRCGCRRRVRSRRPARARMADQRPRD
jgi:bacteriocin biosynthesis cyclodehydratase domain-containing protein